MAGLYLHIPFCTQRCSYCDFYFVTTARTHAGFVQALCLELEYYAADYNHEPIETIYFGGGTPSRLHLDEVARLLATVEEHYDTAPLREVTFELNPEDADLDYLRGLRTLGVDRLSIGIQSFFDEDLTFMNRSHDASQAAGIIPLVRKAGFDNFSVDLIFGLPDQPPEYWGANLEKAVSFEVPHLSCYSLTVEPRTPLAKQIELGHVAAPEEDAVAERFQFTMDFLRSRGYDHYEISSYALPGRRAQHNSLYWEHANYLGFGPSAHSFWWHGLPNPRATRWANVRNLKRYEALLQGRHAPVEFRDVLDFDVLANEHILLRLRTADGLDLDHLEDRYGVDLYVEKIDALAYLEGEGLIDPIRNSRLRLTDAGKLVCDAITERLMLELEA